MKAFLQNLSFSVSVILLFLAALLGILAILGFRPFIVDSASMEPMYEKGDFILADTRVKDEDAQIGDVLIYRADSGALVMHRLVDKNTFKGDANVTSEHVELNNSNLIGKVVYAVESPVFTFIVEHPKLSLGLAAFFIILFCLPDSKRKEIRNERV